MKRIGAILCLLLIVMTMTASLCYADTGSLSVEKSSPKDGYKGAAVENLSVKIYFNKGVIPKNEGIRVSNAEAFKLTDEKGKEVPIQILYSHKEEGMMMVLSDSSKKKVTIEGDMTYTLTIDSSFQGTNGEKLDKPAKVGFTTLNQSTTMKVNMGMMGVMFVGMIFFSTRSMKKQQEKERTAQGKTDTVNPYKEAKRTGKSVEAIVEKDKKAKEKQANKAQKNANKKGNKMDADDNIDSDNLRVAGPKPISAAGSKYKSGRKAQAEAEKAKKAKATTRPKSQTGKQKNTKKK
ncbi:MAG: Ig-like domain-containing protein [Anaerovoracaceae bacterium]